MTDRPFESWEIDADGLTVRVDLYSDYDANANPAGEGDVYDADMVAAHARGDWEFVGVVVTPVIGEQEIGAATDSLWSVEYGYYDGWRSGHLPSGRIDRAQLERYPIPGMISEVRGNLARVTPGLITALQGVSLDDCPAYNPNGQAGGELGQITVANAHCSRAEGHAMPHRDYDGEEWS